MNELLFVVVNYVVYCFVVVVYCLGSYTRPDYAEHYRNTWGPWSQIHAKRQTATRISKVCYGRIKDNYY